MTNYNIDLKVPLIIRYPNQPNRGKQTEAFTELVDIFPSLCELAGIPVPDYMQGTSFVPLLEQPDRNWKKAAFSQFHRRPQVSADGKRYMGYSINTTDYHYIAWYDWDHQKGEKGAFRTAELYDRINDPHESVNLAPDEKHREIMEALSKQLEEGWRNAKVDGM